MKIIVCMKQVPATTQVEIDPETGSMKRSGSSTRTNPYDLFALETALRIREKNRRHRNSPDYGAGSGGVYDERRFCYGRG